jgi:multimeric flavodoxin WrbA
MVKAVGIAGSPRRAGNSATLLRVALQGAEVAGAETKLVHLNDLTYRGCQGCAECGQGGECILQDELTPVLAALRETDIWLLASPIYHDGLSGQFKSFFDRCAAWEGENRLPGKRRAAMIITYMEQTREDYLQVARTVPYYLGWMGDFGEVPLLDGAGLGPADAAAGRADLLAEAGALGRGLVEELGRRDDGRR